MNPFVNFRKRGVQLPQGCKDLIDVLKPASQAMGFRTFLAGVADRAKWMCMRCSEELLRFLTQELGPSFNDLPMTDQTESLGRVAPKAEAHLKRWASERGSK